jgi:hypothetical protein
MIDDGGGTVAARTSVRLHSFRERLPWVAACHAFRVIACRDAAMTLIVVSDRRMIGKTPVMVG